VKLPYPPSSEAGNCPFCAIAQYSEHEFIIAHNTYAILIRDGYPVTPGHSLIIPKRHVGSYFDITDAEKQCLQELLELAKAQLDSAYQPSDYNIGINDGPAAGQTVPHCHIHLIPRYEPGSPHGEDGGDPRGGVRWVVPGKADYWSDHKR